MRKKKERTVTNSIINRMIEWQCADTWGGNLTSDGWYTPDTYNNGCRSITNEPAVYLFLLHETHTYKKAIVAYVGMSTNLKQRMQSHPILNEIWQPGYWPQRWFKPTPKTELRGTEAELIAEINPPWNIQGRKRGVLLP